MQNQKLTVLDQWKCFSFGFLYELSERRVDISQLVVEPSIMSTSDKL